MREVAVIVSNDNVNVTYEQTIEAIKKAGFKNVFIHWDTDNWEKTKEQLRCIREFGLNIIFAHLSYQGINDIWQDIETGQKLVNKYKNDIRLCKENNIPMVIMHVTSKSVAPMYNELGLQRLREIVDYAEKLGIQVAFENTKIKGYLEYIIENISNKNAGICFDSGHFHVYFHDDWDLTPFKNRVIAVHLHDNDTSDDQHLIPFDGTLNWDNVINKLKECCYTGLITLESCYSNAYLEMSIEDFYQKSYEAGKKLQNKFNRK